MLYRTKTKIRTYKADIRHFLQAQERCFPFQVSLSNLFILLGHFIEKLVRPYFGNSQTGCRGNQMRAYSGSCQHFVFPGWLFSNLLLDSERQLICLLNVAFEHSPVSCRFLTWCKIWFTSRWFWQWEMSRSAITHSFPSRAEDSNNIKTFSPYQLPIPCWDNSRLLWISAVLTGLFILYNLMTRRINTLVSQSEL